MKTLTMILAAACLAALPSLSGAKEASDWSMNATIIEACSCPMFCQCYFNSEPAAMGGHGDHAGHGAAAEHFCKFNNAYRVNKGSYGDVKLDGTTFWLAGDLGAEFTDGEMEWAVLTFDPSVTKEQREGIQAILMKVMGVKWKSFTVAPDAKIEWNGGKDRSVAKLDGGKQAEVVLASGAYAMNGEPAVIKNLQYWGAPRNDGFVLMKNEVEAYRVGDKAFEFKGTNGFMITFDISSKDVK